MCERINIMQNIRSALFAVAGLAVMGIAAAFAVSLTLIVGLLLTATLGARMLMLKAKPRPVYAKTRKEREMRVWNDGRGTIIDQ